MFFEYDDLLSKNIIFNVFLGNKICLGLQYLYDQEIS